MMDNELTTNYMAAVNHLLKLIEGTNRAIIRSKQDDDTLEIRQYKHLRADYLKQLADLMDQSPEPIRLELVAH